MKNPLRKRIPRELKGEFGKYLVVFILMVTTIGMVSGFLVADGSMIQAYNEGFEKYNIEDGNFRTGERLYRGQREAIEEEGVKVYENYYIEDTLTNGSTMRFFKNRTDVNKVCLMDGKLAEKTGEIAIDRMYADNNDLKIGRCICRGSRMRLLFYEHPQKPCKINEDQEKTPASDHRISDRNRDTSDGISFCQQFSL